MVEKEQMKKTKTVWLLKTHKYSVENKRAQSDEEVWFMNVLHENLLAGTVHRLVSISPGDVTSRAIIGHKFSLDRIKLHHMHELLTLIFFFSGTQSCQSEWQRVKT